jgi:hypothetical protein
MTFCKIIVALISILMLWIQWLWNADQPPVGLDESAFEFLWFAFWASTLLRAIFQSTKT